MASRRTLKRRQQRYRLAHPPQAHPLTVAERWLLQENMEMLKSRIALASAFNRPMVVGTISVTLPRFESGEFGKA